MSKGEVTLMPEQTKASREKLRARLADNLSMVWVEDFRNTLDACDALEARVAELEDLIGSDFLEASREKTITELRARVATLKTEGDKWWGVLCEASDALGGPTPEKAPFVPEWIRKLNERLATLEAERKHMVALIETIKIEYPSMARELELDDLPTQEESTK